MGQDKKRIVYLDDNNKTQTLLAVVEEINSNFVIIRTNTNRIMIPVSRILKIKENLEVQDD